MINNPMIFGAAPPQTEEKTVALAMASGNQVIEPSQGKLLTKITVTKPSTMIPDNIRKNIDIGGVVGTLEGGGGGSGNYLVRAIDYDGTVLKEARLNTGDTFTLPEIPTHPRLIAQGWSSPVDIVDNTITVTDSDITVGIMYETASGLTEFDIELTKVTGLNVTCKMEGNKDWGDGTSDNLTTHTYTAYGRYTIKCDGTIIPGYVMGQINNTNYTLISIFISKTVTFIGNFAFNGCYSLTTIAIPNGVTSIGYNAFYGCYSLMSIAIPNGVTSIGASAFYGCYSLTSIAIPNGVTSIRDYAFYGCYSLTTIAIPNSVTSIGASAFYGCYSLTSIAIPNGVTSIRDYAFSYCYSLTSIAIPNGVTSIGTYAFYYCYSLTSITIPNSVTSIGNDAFSYCYSIVLYNFSDATAVLTLSNSNAFNNINHICKIVVPDNLYDEWIAAANWSTYANYIYKASEVNLEEAV